MSIRKQVFLKRTGMVARHNPHIAMMRLLAKGVAFERAAKFVAAHA